MALAAGGKREFLPSTEMEALLHITWWQFSAGLSPLQREFCIWKTGKLQEDIKGCLHLNSAISQCDFNGSAMG